MSEPELTQFQATARISRLVGQKIKLPYGTSHVVWSIGDDRLILKYRINKVRSIKGGEVIQAKTEHLLVWNRDPETDKWVAQAPLIVKLITPGEHVRSYDISSPLDRAEKARWTRLGGG
jgi:hypothetical protein